MRITRPLDADDEIFKRILDDTDFRERLRRSEGAPGEAQLAFWIGWRDRHGPHELDTGNRA